MKISVCIDSGSSLGTRYARYNSQKGARKMTMDSGSEVVEIKNKISFWAKIFFKKCM